jgi:CRISPR/Cas system-associated exonuclease Cas4 (RecB family)
MQLTSIQHLREASEEDKKKALGHVQIIPKIEAYLEDMNLEDNGRALGVFSASDLGNKTGTSLCGDYPIGCARLLYYRYIEEEPQENIPTRIRRIFDTGHGVHAQLQGYLNNIAKKLKSETFVDEAVVNGKNSDVADSYEIDSTTDGIWTITAPKLSLRYGLEIKSMKDDLFKRLNGPEKYHVVQSIVYMACLDLPFMVVLYYNKNDSSMAEFVIEFDGDIWKAVTKKINYVRRCAVDEKEPERELGFHCKTCRYAHVCKPPKPEKRNIRVGRRKFALGGGV